MLWSRAEARWRSPTRGLRGVEGVSAGSRAGGGGGSGGRGGVSGAAGGGDVERLREENLGEVVLDGVAQRLQLRGTW